MTNDIKTLLGKDTISATEGTAYIEVNSENVILFYIKSLEAKLAKNKQDIKVVGNRMTGHKTTSVTGTGTLAIYEVTSRYKEMFLDYIKTGKDIYVNILCKNEDVSTSYGAETKVLTGVNFDEITIAQLNSEDGVLEEELPFTFEGVELLSKYND